MEFKSHYNYSFGLLGEGGKDGAEMFCSFQNSLKYQGGKNIPALPGAGIILFSSRN